MVGVSSATFSTTSVMRFASNVIVTTTLPMPEALAEYVPGT